MFRLFFVAGSVTVGIVFLLTVIVSITGSRDGCDFLKLAIIVSIILIDR